MNILIRLVILAVAIYVASSIIPGVKIDSYQTLFVTSIVVGVINTFIKPILVFLTFPLTLLTFGIFLLILNGVLILIVGAIVPGFHVNSFLAAVLFSIVVSLVTSLLSKFA